MRRDGGGFEVGEASCEVERNEKEVDGVGHADITNCSQLLSVEPLILYEFCYILVSHL